MRCVSNHQPPDCLLKYLCRSKKTSKLHVTGLCEGNSLVTGEIPVQRTSNAENVSIWWHHHAIFAKDTLESLPAWRLMTMDKVICDIILCNGSLTTFLSECWARNDVIYCQTSNVSGTLIGNKIVDHSDVVGALPVSTAPTTSSFLT